MILNLSRSKYRYPGCHEVEVGRDEIAIRQRLTADVRFGSKADVTLLNFDVRFTPKSGHSRTRSGCLHFEATSVRNRWLDRQNDLEQGPVVALRRRSKSTAMTFDNRAADSQS